MNSEIARLAFQLTRSFEGGAWHGPGVLELLEDVSPEAAYRHPIPGAHSIWELVLHLTGTYRLVLRRLQGDSRSLTADEDWPAAPSATAENWRKAINSLSQLNDELRDAVLRFNPEQLDQALIAEPPFTAYTQFIGITQHNLYHAGQIALLKRAVAQADSRSV